MRLASDATNRHTPFTMRAARYCRVSALLINIGFKIVPATGSCGGAGVKVCISTSGSSAILVTTRPEELKREFGETVMAIGIIVSG